MKNFIEEILYLFLVGSRTWISIVTRSAYSYTSLWYVYQNCSIDDRCISYLEYACLRTKPSSNIPKDIPIVHNPDERFYIQPLQDNSVLIGGFLRESKPIFSNGVPDTFNYSLLPDNWDDFRELYFSSIDHFFLDHRLS